jgi:sugar diacid utilization regulator
MMHENPSQSESATFLRIQDKTVVRGWPSGDDAVCDQLSALRSLLVLSILMTRQDSQASILQVAVNAVESLGPCKALGIFVDDQWQDVHAFHREGGSLAIASGAGPQGPGRFEVPGMRWSWAFPLSSTPESAGYLVAGAEGQPTESAWFLLQALAQQAGLALANARLHRRERKQATQLRAANFALRRSMEIHDRLTRVALGRDGQDGIAQAVFELTGRSVAIEDRFGNLRAWAGPGRPDPYPRYDPDLRDRLLARIVAAASPVRDGNRLISAALLGGTPIAVLALNDPQRTAGDTERVAIEHASTVLAMEVARLQSMAETESRLRTGLVLDLVAGDGIDEPGVLDRAQALGYDLGRPHRVAVVEGAPADGEADRFFRAVSRAVTQVKAGSLLAPRLRDVVVLADTQPPWEEFRKLVIAALHGGRCRVGVGGRCAELDGFARSYQEAVAALRVQKAVGGPDQVIVFDDLGVYKVLMTANETFAMERFVEEWLRPLIDYDSARGTQLVLTLTEYLDCGGNYDASAKALSVHRNTLKYRLRRIREVSGHNLGHPGTQFNLQLATRAWRTLQALRQSLLSTCPALSRQDSRLVRLRRRDGGGRSLMLSPADLGQTTG